MARSWIIGSRPECDIMADRPTVSGRHCRLTQDDTGLTLEDLGSSNGTFVNGTRLASGQPVRIVRGDVITLGPTVRLPWPPALASAGARTLRVGREADNDMVIDAAMVSGHHARVVWDGPSAEAVVEDLGSSNGTAVGSPERKTRCAVLSASDTIFLGTHPIAAAQLLWRLDSSLIPTLSFRGRPVVIGRNADCDQVFDVPMVSGRHARLVRSEGQTWIEDLGSSNGTYVNGQRVDRSALRPGDLIGLGTFLVVFDGEPAVAARPAVAATQVPPRVAPAVAATQVVPSVVAPQSAAPPVELVLEPLAATTADAPVAPGGFAGECATMFSQWWRLVGLLAQVPVVAILIVLLLRIGSEGPALTPEGWNPAARTLAATLFWLGLSAAWFGLANALLGVPFSAERVSRGEASGRSGRVAARFVVLGVLGVLQCVLLYGVVALGAGLKGPGALMLALLVMTSIVGLALGLAVVALSPRPELSWLALPVVMLPLWLFGGEFRPLPQMAAWARPVSALLPTRWAFEGLLLLETERYPWRVTETPTGSGSNEDLAEHYFPAETHRMGIGADTTALLAMLVGLTAAAAFLAASARPSLPGAVS